MKTVEQLTELIEFTREQYEGMWLAIASKHSQDKDRKYLEFLQGQFVKITNALIEIRKGVSV